MAAETGFDVKLTAMEFAPSLDRSFTGNYTTLPDRLDRAAQCGRQRA